MKKFFIKLFLSYILVFVLPLMITVLVSYLCIGNGMKKNADADCRREIAKLLDIYDEEFNKIDKIAMELSFSNWVKKIYNSRMSYDIDEMPWDVYETDENINSIVRYVVLNNYFFDMGVVFPKQDCVISSNGITTFEQFFNSNFKFGQMTDSDWRKSIETLPGKLFFSPETLEYKNYNYYGLKIDTAVYLSGIPALDSSIKAYAIAYIKADKLIENLKKFTYIKNALLCIVDENGRQLGNTEGGTGNNIFDNLDSGLIANAETDKLNRVRIDERDFFLYCSYIPRTSLKLITIIPQNSVMSEMNKMTNVTVIAVIACSILGFVLSYLIAVKNYFPIIKIFKLFSSRYSEKNISFEKVNYKLLHESVSTLISEEDLLRKRVNSFMPIIQNAYISNILTGSIQYDNSLENRLSSLGISFRYSAFVTVMITFFNEMGVENSKKEKICMEMEARGVKAFFAEIDGKHKCIIINFGDKGMYENYIVDLEHLIEVNVGSDFVITVSSIYYCIGDMSNSYNQAVHALDYKLAYDNLKVIFYDRINKDSGTPYYPISTEQYIIRAIKAYKKECISAIIKQIITTNTESGNYSPDNAKCLYYNLIGTALKLLDEFKLASELKIEILDFYKHENMYEIENYIISLFDMIYEAVNREKSSTDDLLLNYIVQYIDNHYNDPNLSLNLIAGQLKKSVSYISSFFKEKTGCCFTDYVNNIRIGKAKELLNGDLTIRQIAELTGYTNDIHFRRVFKKYEGITPGVYVVINNL